MDWHEFGHNLARRLDERMERRLNEGLTPLKERVDALDAQVAALVDLLEIERIKSQ
ncbi:MAG: hypothetical protein H6923_01190 [Alphaproteobacteria bacterium]|nr:hypothetical protein [Alphaproteobacteria bacterium]